VAISSDYDFYSDSEEEVSPNNRDKRDTLGDEEPESGNDGEFMSLLMELVKILFLVVKV